MDTPEKKDEQPQMPAKPARDRVDDKVEVPPGEVEQDPPDHRKDELGGLADGTRSQQHP